MRHIIHLVSVLSLLALISFSVSCQRQSDSEEKAEESGESAPEESGESAPTEGEESAPAESAPAPETGGDAATPAPTGPAGQPDQGGEHVPFKEREPETETVKAERLIRQLTNYLLGIKTATGTPADLEAAKAALQETNKISWPNDPWGNPYAYEVTDGDFEVYSHGPDGTPGTEDDVHVSE